MQAGKQSPPDHSSHCQLEDHVDQHTTENTPLLLGSTYTPLSSHSPTFRVYTGPSKFSQQRTRGIRHLSKHRKQLPPPSPSKFGHDPERVDEEEDAKHYQSPRQKDKSPLRFTSARSSTSTTVDDYAETCESPSDTLAGSSPCSNSRSLFSLPQGISLTLENNGSVARDHLACERTFLAYMRTSLAIAASGVAIVQLFSAASASVPQGSTHRLEVYIRPLGASTIVVGLLVLVIGVTRYFTVQAALVKGYFPAARLVTGLIAMVLTALVTLTFGILLAGKLEARRE